jgi:hypothetical protein
MKPRDRWWNETVGFFGNFLIDDQLYHKLFLLFKSDIIPLICDPMNDKYDVVLKTFGLLLPCILHNNHATSL